MTTPLLLYNFVFFFVLILGLGLPWLATWKLSPTEKLVLGAGWGTFLTYLFAGVVYCAGLPSAAFQFLPFIAVVSILARWRYLAQLGRDRDARATVGRQLLFSTWCVGWLALVKSYSGGEWAGDWYEHYERALFFLKRGPLDFKFLSIYLEPARPPLANLADGAIMGIIGWDFASFQLANTLFCSLIFLPAALFVRQFKPTNQRGEAILLLMMMCSPIMVQNATFSWTKLQTMFFAVMALAFYVHGASDSSPVRRTVAAIAVSAAFLTHYSAGPYLAALAGFQVWHCWQRRSEQAPARELVLQGILVCATLTTWFAWSIQHYGLSGTFASNTTVTLNSQPSPSAWIWTRIWNFFVTLVPHPFRPSDYSFIAQTSRLGYLRDYWFNVYQTTLPGAFGLAGLLAFAGTFFRSIRSPVQPAGRRFWIWITACAFVLGVIVVPTADRWGVVHVCLIGLLVVGFAWLAARLEAFPRTAYSVWLGALAIDLLVGIVLPFYIQHSTQLLNTFSPDFLKDMIHPLSYVAVLNLRLKIYSHITYVGDGSISPWLIGTLLTVCLLTAVAQLGWRGKASARRPDALNGIGDVQDQPVSGGA